MSNIEKTVFISYRRTDISWALAIFQHLTQHGYDVFFDFQGISSGDFERVILENIRARAHFLVVLTPSALERCGEPGDWLRREIETALEAQRNIVPLMLENFDFAISSIESNLTGRLSVLKRYNALRVPADYFAEAMGRLREKFLSIPVHSVLHLTSTRALQVVGDQQAAARAAPPVDKAQLTAQESLDRGAAPYSKDDLKGAVVREEIEPQGFLSNLLDKPVLSGIVLVLIYILSIYISYRFHDDISKAIMVINEAFGPTPPYGSQSWIIEQGHIRISDIKAKYVYCLDVVDENVDTNETKLQLWDCHNPVSIQQTWTLEGGAIKVGDKKTKCLDVPESEQLRDNTYVQISDCHTPVPPRQTWTIRDDRIISGGGKCLDAEKPVGNQAKVRISSCNFSPKELPTFVDWILDRWTSSQ